LIASSLFTSMPTLVSSYYFKVYNEGRFYYPIHFHEDICELLLITEGEGIFQVDDRHYKASSGNLMCYNRLVWHEEKSTSDVFEAMYIGFKGLQVTNLPLDHFLERGQQARIDLKEQFVQIKQLMSDIIFEHKNIAPESAIITDQLLGVLIGRLSRHVHYKKDSQQMKKPSAVAAQQGKIYIELNYQSDINLEVLAKITHVDQYHFCHLFKQETGMSPIQYLIRYRMEVAKQYLSATDMTIAKISELVGYKSDTYFQNVFKKVTGISPGKFRSESWKSHPCQ